MDDQTMLIIFAAVSTVTFIVAGVWTWKRVVKQQDQSTDYSDADKVLEEVEVLLAFGDTKKAIEILEKAHAINGSDVKIVAKLSELNSQRS